MNPFFMNAVKKDINLNSLNQPAMSESPEARYWREKYEVSTRHLMVAVKEWGKLRQQIEEYRGKAA